MPWHDLKKKKGLYQCFLFNDFKSQHAKWHNSNTPKIICDQQVLGSAACSQWTLEMWFLHFLQCLWTFTFSERCEALHLFLKLFLSQLFLPLPFSAQNVWKLSAVRRRDSGYIGTERLGGLVILGTRGWEDWLHWDGEAEWIGYIGTEREFWPFSVS